MKPLFTARYIVPPSTNHIYQRGRHGKVVKTLEYTQWRSAARAVYQSARIWKHSHVKMPITHDISVKIVMNIDLRQDIANREKGIVDALEDAGIIENDRQIARLVIERSQASDDLGLNEYTIEVTEWQK